MKVYTANEMHEKRTEVYQAAVQAPVKITHKHHGDFILQMCDVKSFERKSGDFPAHPEAGEFVTVKAHGQKDQVVKIKSIDELSLDNRGIGLKDENEILKSIVAAVYKSNHKTHKQVGKLLGVSAHMSMQLINRALRSIGMIEYSGGMDSATHHQIEEALKCASIRIDKGGLFAKITMFSDDGIDYGEIDVPVAIENKGEDKMLETLRAAESYVSLLNNMIAYNARMKEPSYDDNDAID